MTSSPPITSFTAYSGGLTSALVKRSFSLAQEPLSADMREIALQSMLDWVGVALAGSSEPLVQILVDQARDEGGHSQASVIGTDLQVTTRQAAMINAAVGHALDYDDTNIGAHGHVTTAVLPAALAVAESRGLGGSALLSAYVAGYEMAGMVGQFLGREHYEQGFHGTCTVGSFGAACAAAILLGQDQTTAAVALSIAGTQAGGMKAQFGTMCKPFHAGKASENGVTGAQLAARGLTAHHNLLAAPQGFGAATSPGVDPRAALILPREGGHLHRNLFKYHAACYGTHATIEALRSIRKQHGIRSEDIRKVELFVEPGAERMCNIVTPRTGLEAKFSLSMNAALALAGDDTSSPSTYSNEITRRPDLLSLRDRVEIRFMPAGWPFMTAEAKIYCHDGRELHADHDANIPDADLKRQRSRVEVKFMALAAPAVGESTALHILRTIAEIERLKDIGSLMSLLQKQSRKQS